MHSIYSNAGFAPVPISRCSRLTHLGVNMPRTGASYSTSDLSRKSGDIIAEALRHPVAITQRNKTAPRPS